jgi:hypothetical protein
MPRKNILQVTLEKRGNTRRPLCGALRWCRPISNKPLICRHTCQNCQMPLEILLSSSGTVTYRRTSKMANFLQLPAATTPEVAVAGSVPLPPPQDARRHMHTLHGQELRRCATMRLGFLTPVKAANKCNVSYSTLTCTCAVAAQVKWLADALCLLRPIRKSTTGLLHLCRTGEARIPVCSSCDRSHRRSAP